MVPIVKNNYQVFTLEQPLHAIVQMGPFVRMQSMLQIIKEAAIRGEKA